MTSAASDPAAFFGAREPHGVQRLTHADQQTGSPERDDPIHPIPPRRQSPLDYPTWATEQTLPANEDDDPTYDRFRLDPDSAKRSCRIVRRHGAAPRWKRRRAAIVPRHRRHHAARLRLADARRCADARCKRPADACFPDSAGNHHAALGGFDRTARPMRAIRMPGLLASVHGMHLVAFALQTPRDRQTTFEMNKFQHARRLNFRNLSAARSACGPTCRCKMD